jgi:hypothetical protein
VKSAEPLTVSAGIRIFAIRLETVKSVSKVVQEFQSFG